MKVAILLPGLIRNIDKTYKSFFANVIESNPKCKIDIYSAFWNKTHIRKRIEKNNIPSSIVSIDSTKVVSTYNPIDYTVLNYDFKQPKFLEQAEKIHPLFPKKHSNIEFCRNSILSQFYTWKQAVNLIPVNNDYDLVLKTRFDIIHTSPIDFASLDPSCMSAGGKWGEKFMIDFAFASSYRNMVKLLNQCYDKVNDNSFVSSFSKLAIPEVILTTLIEDLNIPIKYDVIKTHLDKNL